MSCTPRIQPLSAQAFQRLSRPHLALTSGDVLRARTDPTALEDLLTAAEPLLRRLCAVVAERPPDEGRGVVDVGREDARDIMQAARLGLWRALQRYDASRGSPDLFLAYGAYVGAFTARRAALRPAAVALVPADDVLVWREDGEEVARGVDAIPLSCADLRVPWEGQLDFVEESTPAERQARAAAWLQAGVDTLDDADERAVAQLVFVEGRSQPFAAEALALPLTRVAALATHARAALVALAHEDAEEREYWHDEAADHGRPARDDDATADEEDPWSDVPPPRRLFAVPRGAMCSDHAEPECPECLPHVFASELDVARAPTSEMADRLRERFQVLPTLPPGDARNIAVAVRARKLARRLGMLAGELEVFDEREEGQASDLDARPVVFQLVG